MRGEGGFGIVTVMAGAVVLGIFALVYTQQIQNRANVSLIGDLMAFREQAITYYGSIVSNRSTWECTIQSNGELQQYLAGCTVPPCPTPKPAGTNLPDGTLNIYDYTGDCQEKFGGAGGILRIPSGGLGLRLQDHNDLPITQRPCDSSSSGTHFCLTVEWEKLDPDQAERRAVELKLVLEANRRAIKNQLDVSFELAKKEHAIYMNRTVATDCSDGRITGYFPGTAKGQARTWHPGIVSSTAAAPHVTSKGVPAYAGDTAVVKFDSVTGLVECSNLGPLVVPPCYDMSDYNYIDDYGSLRNTYVNPFISGTGMPGYRGFQSDKGFDNIIGSKGLRCDSRSGCCDGDAGNTCPCSSRPASPSRVAVKGRCPETAGSGTTAIAYFDSNTGISHCSNPNILVEKVDESETAKNCDELNQYGVIQIRAQDDSGGAVGTFQCSTHRWGAGTGGVEVNKGPCGPNYALAGFGNTGEINACAAGKGAQTSRPPGFPGPRGLKGREGRCFGGLPGRDSYQTCPSPNCFPCGDVSSFPNLPCYR